MGAGLWQTSWVFGAEDPCGRWGEKPPPLKFKDTSGQMLSLREERDPIPLREVTGTGLNSLSKRACSHRPWGRGLVWTGG